jgi:hypothetical protein
MSEVETIPTPEAGALLQISRVTGQTQLFASEFNHQHFIRLRITPAKTCRSLSQTWYMGQGKPYIEVDLSASQFAEAITTLNVGVGTPCTMRHLNGREFEPVAPIDERPIFETEGSQVLADCIAAIDNAQAALDAATLTAKAKQSIQAGITSARRKLSESLPFLEEQYKERLDTVEQQAKTEIAAYFDHAVHQVGIEALRNPKLLGGTIDE